MSPPAPIDRPDVIFFDLGDTLMRTHPSWAGVYRLGLAEHGIEVDEDELARALTEAAPDHWLMEGPFEASEQASFARVKQYDQEVLAAKATSKRARSCVRWARSPLVRVAFSMVTPRQTGQG